jgi:putative methionine-R-sulfoxide reductase with GAF domain
MVEWVCAQPPPPVLDRASLEALLSYRVPKLTPEGTCGVGLEDTPHDVVQGFRERSEEDLLADASVIRVWRLREVVRLLARELGAEWVGVYEARRDPAGTRALEKLAYVGSPSRAFFPLTDAFAAHSNNSTVAMTAQAVVYRDLSGGVNPENTPYYVCDTRVLFEACVPIFRHCSPRTPADVLGIIDLEAWRPRHLTDAGVALLLHVCDQIAQARLLVPSS